MFKSFTNDSEIKLSFPEASLGYTPLFIFRFNLSYWPLLSTFIELWARVLL